MVPLFSIPTDTLIPDPPDRSRSGIHTIAWHDGLASHLAASCATAGTKRHQLYK